MSDEENFLSRWSRRKQEAAAVAPAPAEGEAAPPAEEKEKPAAAEPFDLSKLPSLDSITAETDMKAFMQPGVPAELRHAALRRAWVTDPTIRDFVGLQENDWDFNKPGAIAGFGPILPEHKVGEMVARLFGEVAKPEADPDLADDMQTPPSSAVSTTSTETSEAVAAAPDATVEHETKSATSNEPTVAVQHDAADARRHGGALPQVNRKS